MSCIVCGNSSRRWSISKLDIAAATWAFPGAASFLPPSPASKSCLIRYAFDTIHLIIPSGTGLRVCAWSISPPAVCQSQLSIPILSFALLAVIRPLQTTTRTHTLSLDASSRQSDSLLVTESINSPSSRIVLASHARGRRFGSPRACRFHHLLFLSSPSLWRPSHHLLCVEDHLLLESQCGRTSEPGAFCSDLWYCFILTLRCQPT